MYKRQVPDPPSYGDEIGRAASFARQAAELALQDAQLELDDIREFMVTVAVGTTDGESQDLDQAAESLIPGGTPLPHGVAIRSHPFTLATAIAEYIDVIEVDAVTIATACSAGNYAIGYGYDAVRYGESDIAVVGGADALCRKTFTGFYRLGTIAPDVCRPFDANREGILTGEGAGILVLEPLDKALERGARIYAEVAGYGLTCDAKHPVAPDVDGVARCINKALHNAQIEPRDVDLISAHGTGTRANDIAECAALKQVYESSIPRTVSVKSMIGHSMGAASAIGAIASSIALAEQFIPPTINHRLLDPECPIDCVPNHAIEAKIDVVENNGLAFGGNNAAVIMRSVA